MSKKNKQQYNLIKQEVIEECANFFNKSLNQQGYDYAILYEEILVGAYLLVEREGRLKNVNNLPIYSTSRIEVDLSDELSGKNVILLINSIEDEKKWRKVEKYISGLREKVKVLSVNILMLDEKLEHKILEQNEPNTGGSQLEKQVVAPHYTDKEILEIAKLKASFDSIPLIKGLARHEAESLLWFTFMSIFETGFMGEESNTEAVIFINEDIYFYYWLYLQEGKIQNKYNKKIILAKNINNPIDKNAVKESTVITIIVFDEKEAEIERLKKTVLEINPKLSEIDFYEERIIPC